MTAAQFNASGGAKKGRVRGTKKTTVDGITFHSKREASRYLVLKRRLELGEICNLKMQVKIPLFGRDGPILTPTGRQMVYIADFQYVDWDISGALVTEDAKGWPTDVFKIKRAILLAQGIDVVTV